MRNFLLLMCALLSIFLLPAQPQRSLLPASKVYAVIIGISKYENGVPQLDFAHRDAQVFADYLRSKAGGAVPEDHVRVLLNGEATYSAIYDALNWLLETCAENDLVYFYFSGHGDMENNTIYKLGFLLASNTPRSNYINNAVRIEDLNNIANTLSIKNKAKVVLITDACHSGKLAGTDYRGTYLVGEQLRTVKSNEVRITSCSPDQLSNEDEGWGGGRGVFSYYLIKGLEGLADYRQDGNITLNEIKNYLDTSLAKDALLAQKIQKQTPVFRGADNLSLAKVDTASLNKVRRQQAVPEVSQQSKPLLKALGVHPQAYLFDLIKKDSIDVLADYEALSKLPKEQIPFRFISMVVDSITNRFGQAVDSGKISLLEQTLRDNSDAWKRFSEKLVVTLSDRGQEIINLYLGGDVAELERRRYYNIYNNGYDVYPYMFAVALKLISPEHPLYKILQVKLHYFTGVAARLKLPVADDPKPLLDLAMAEQKKAFELEENAAYIQVELGTIHDYKGEFTAAEKYYLRATEIAPSWAIPWANLIGVYANTKKYEKALSASKKAIELQRDFQGNYINTGVVYQQTGNLLMAEELFQKSIKMNSRHYLPFEGLAYLYMNETLYDLADHYFLEAELRKRGFRNPRRMVLPMTVLPAIEVFPANVCYVDSTHVGKSDVMGHFALGINAFNGFELVTAEREFKKVIALDGTNPLAFHYLGITLYKQQRWKEADIIFNYAISNYLTDSLFILYVDSMSAQVPQSDSKLCIINSFRDHYYQGIEDHYFIAAVYETWHHLSEAETHYRKIIELDPPFVGGYYKLWSMLENAGRYNDAENMIRQYEFYDRDISARELASFYRRMTERLPEDGDWFYKAGLFLYHFGAAAPDSFLYDKKKMVPDFDSVAFTQTVVPSFQKAPGIYKKFVLPGTMETIVIADKIVYPFSSGIRYLEKADSLLQNSDDAIADINYKIGDMYSWQGLPEKAMPHYKRSVELKPADANTRIKLIGTYSAIYYLSDALAQLDSLEKRSEINFPMQLLMARYCIHAGRFTEAQNLLKEAKQIHPFKVSEITDLNGRLHLLSDQPKQALAFYKDYLSENPGDRMAMYTIARLYAQMKNKKEALKWLKLSVDNGFNYKWVLWYDSPWQDYKNLSQWKEITRLYETPVI